MIRPRRRPALLLLLCVFAASSSIALWASQARPVDLDQMTRRAARIFSGRCVESRVEHDASIDRAVVVSVFRVSRAVKGVEGRTAVVRMLAAPSSADGEQVSGLPTFKPGDEVVLFLYGDSSLGLTSPVGLGQGRFKVLKDKQGRRVALNDFGNARLFTSPQSPGARGSAAAPIDPDTLLDRAEALARGGRP